MGHVMLASYEEWTSMIIPAPRHPLHIAPSLLLASSEGWHCSLRRILGQFQHPKNIALS